MECFFNDSKVLITLCFIIFWLFKVLIEICKDASGRKMSTDEAHALISSKNVFGPLRTSQQVYFTLCFILNIFLFLKALYALFDLQLHGPYAQSVADGDISTTDVFQKLADVALPVLERTPNYAYHHRFLNW